MFNVRRGSRSRSNKPLAISSRMLHTRKLNRSTRYIKCFSANNVCLLGDEHIYLSFMMLSNKNIKYDLVSCLHRINGHTTQTVNLYVCIIYRDIYRTGGRPHSQTKTRGELSCILLSLREPPVLRIGLCTSRAGLSQLDLPYNWVSKLVPVPVLKETMGAASWSCLVVSMS